MPEPLPPLADASNHPADALLLVLKSRRTGLDEQEAKERLGAHGQNALPSGKRLTAFRLFVRQFREPFSLVLLTTSILSYAFNEKNDALIIFAVLVINACIGLFHERRAGKALESLRESFIQTCRVLRDGQERSIEIKNIVPGDIVLIGEGDRLPADGRFLEIAGLRVDESALTGESIAVAKTAEALRLPERAPLGDHRNLGFAGTLATNGHGTLLVIATGVSTQLGLIASSLKDEREEPPLIKKFRRLSKQILLIIAGFSLVLFAYSLFLGRPIEIILPAILSLAVSIIPEGLPLVVTVVLAREVNAMAKKNAVVRNLSAVETLSEIDVICSDKTGTLTKNRLAVAGHWQPEGQNQEALVKASTLSVNGSTADPIDNAVLAFAKAAGLEPRGWNMIDERPFDYATRLRLTFMEREGVRQAFMGGSPEAVLEACNAADDADAQKALKSMARKALRVLAFAEAEAPSLEKAAGRFRLVGFLGLKDELRPEAKASIAWCKSQGLTVAMITGDHPETALAIGKELGIAHRKDEVIAGSQIDDMDAKALAQTVARYHIFARINPLHKRRIIDAYRANGKRVAMTGDGVNDAPALHAADIGIAMGKNGTDVAREAADIVLLDDNFATIVTAIKGAREVLANIRKVVNYLLSANASEALVIGLALIFALPLPIVAVQILWLNLVTDIFLDVALSMEPPHGASHYRKRAQAILDGPAVARIALLASSMAFTSLLVYGIGLRTGLDEKTVQSLTLLALASSQWWNAWSSRSETLSVFQYPLFANKPLLLATFVVVLLQIGAYELPLLREALHTTPPPLTYWIPIVLGASLVLVADEIRKYVLRKRMVI